MLLLVLTIMMIAIPVAVKLSQERTQIKSQAASEGEVTFAGTNVKQDANGNLSTSTPDVQVKVTSPFGPRRVN